MSKLPLSILLVEDHLAIARQVLDFLDGLGWQTDHAGTGGAGRAIGHAQQL